MGLTLLVTTAYYWPERSGNAPYVAAACEALAARGDRVVVVTGFPHYPDWRSKSASALEAPQLRRGVEIYRRPHYVPETQTLARRLRYEVSFYVALSRLRSLPIGQVRPDLVLGISPTLSGAASAARISRRLGCPYAVVFQDVMSLAVAQTGFGGASAARGVEVVEARVARGAHAIGVVSDAFRDFFLARGVAEERVATLPNWALYDDPSESVESIRARNGWHGKQVVLHAGNQGRKQDLDHFIAAAASEEARNFTFVLAGGGSDHLRLRRLAGQLRSPVQFVEVQDNGSYAAMLRAADILVLTQRESLTDASIPSKLTSYFSAGRPVVAAVSINSAAAEEIRRSGGGVVVSPNSPASLLEGITGLARDIDTSTVLGLAGRRYARGALDARAGLKRYQDFVDLAVGRPATPEITVAVR